MPRRTSSSKKKSAKKKSAAKRRKKAADAPSLLERITEFAAEWNPFDRIPYLRAIVATVAAIAVFAVIWRGVPQVRQHVRTHGMVEPDAIEIRFLDEPAWMNDEFRDRLTHSAQRPLSGDPLNRADLVLARKALANTGWFESVTQVSRPEPGVIEVDATFATQFAAVRDGDLEYVIDPHGRLLPPKYPIDYPHGLVVITNPGLSHPSGAGQTWPGHAVPDAINLLALLRDKEWFHQVSEIDARDAGRNRLIIVTNIGARIHWGSPPGREQPLEMTAEDKIQYLDRSYQNSASFRIDWNQPGDWNFLTDTMTQGS